jgi:threonine dehydratase
LIPFEWVEQARDRITSHIQVTPLMFDNKHQIYIKWENHQVTGSFKLRGATNKIMSLEPVERERGLVCASAGNHGQGVGFVAKKLGVQAEVFVAESVPEVKLKKMQASGAKIHMIAGGFGEAEAAGLEYAVSQGKTWISPYNDGQVIAGQGTIALEIMDQLDRKSPVVWLVPVGGGGLISGVGTVTTRLTPGPYLLGVQPTDNAFMHALFYQGQPDGWQDLDSLADGLTGAVQVSSVTIPIVKHVVDKFILVSEEEIASAIAFAWHAYHEIIEGAGAVTLAALLSGKVMERPAVAIVSGGNINPQLHAEIVSRFDGKFDNELF